MVATLLLKSTPLSIAGLPRGSPRYGVNLAFVGAGPNGADLDWTRRFFAKLNERRAFGAMWGWAMHHYSWNVSSGRTTDWFQGKGDAVNYNEEEWYELLHEADRIEGMITECWNVMGEIRSRTSREARS